MKVCGICKVPKTLSEFGKDKRSSSGLRYCCKLCRRKEYNAEQKAAYNKIWYEANWDRVNADVKKYATKHKHEIKVYKNAYDKIKAQESIGYKIKRNLRARFRAALRHDIKQGSSIQELGCSVKDFKSYLESKFYNGMTWDNYGLGKNKWQIDHIKALRLFNLSDKLQFKEAVHYTNLQPLWYNDHVIKTKKDRRILKCKS